MQHTPTSQGAGDNINIRSKTFLYANELLLTLITNTALLLTFGAMFPPLAVALLINVLVLILRSKLELGRFINTAVETNQIQYIDAIEAECVGVLLVQQEC